MTKRLAKEVVIFDFDGTIVDSMQAFADIAAHVIPKYYSMDAQTARRKYLETSGIPFFQQLEVLFPNDESNDIAADEFERIKKKDFMSKPAYSGTRETLENLRKRGIKTVVSSNNFQELVDPHVEKLGIIFDIVLGFKTNFAKGKDHFAYIEKVLNVQKEKMLFVGDSIKDGERAESFGIDFIGKTGTFTKDEFKSKFPNSEIINDIIELQDILADREI